jgi:hypothetical protein
MRHPCVLPLLLLAPACHSATNTEVEKGPAARADAAAPHGGPAAKGDAGGPGGKNENTTPTTPVVGIPPTGTLSIPIPGGGPAGATPMMPGCTPASADECPTVSGTCATSATSNPKVINFGVLCLFGGTYTESGKPAALLEYLHETAGGLDYYRFRLTFSTSFVDNTFGQNAIGWGTKGHTFKDLVGSDHAEFKLFDKSFSMVSEFKVDYISQDTTAVCGYRALGVSGGEGKMLVGDAKYILGSSTSFSRDLAGCGYCKSAACNGDCTVDSPLTDVSYAANSATPNWDYRVQYEVWVDAAVFGSNGFGGVSVDYVHASPSKDLGGNTITVVPRSCTPPGGCAPGSVEYLTAEGAVECKPGPPNGDCPSEYEEFLTKEGAVCIPSPPTTNRDAGVGCAPGTVDYLTAEGAPMCVPTPPAGGPCAAGTAEYVRSEGAVCLPIPTNGTCPKGYSLDPRSEGKLCI